MGPWKKYDTDGWRTDRFCQVCFFSTDPRGANVHDHRQWKIPNSVVSKITCIHTHTDLAIRTQEHRTTMLTLIWRWSPFLEAWQVWLLIGGRIAFQEPTLIHSSGRWWVDSAHFLHCLVADLSFWSYVHPSTSKKFAQVGMKSIEKPEKQCHFPTLSSCSREAFYDVNFPLRSAVHWFWIT